MKAWWCKLFHRAKNITILRMRMHRTFTSFDMKCDKCGREWVDWGPPAG